MKKVGIITLYHKNYNFGGQLQAYALQQKVESLGFSAEVLDCDLSTVQGRRVERFKSLGLSKSLRIFYMKMRMKLKKMLNLEFKRNIERKNKKFKDFCDFIPHSEYAKADNASVFADKYDMFITGSDQVWNPAIWCGVLLLDFVPVEKKKISYAASILTTKFSEKEQLYLQEQLSSFNAVSVREIGAKILLDQVCDVNITQVLDPTLLWNADFWENHMLPPKIEQPYAFVYMMGNRAGTKKLIRDFCRRNGLRMVLVPHNQGHYRAEDEKYGDVLAYDIGPREWLGYIKNANYVFMSSFHGTAFSLNFKKNFWSFEEPKLDAPKGSMRMESLLMQIGLTDRIRQIDNFPSDEEIIKPIDYTGVNEKLAILQNESEQFLKSALGKR